MKASKLIALFLTLVMFLSLGTFEAWAAESEGTSSLPSYLHPNQLPLTDEAITLRVAVLCEDVNTAPEKSWMFNFIEQKMGIDVELEYFYNTNRAESLALMMADGNLPDMIIGCALTSNEIANYGETQGLFLDMAPYINEENAPNLTKFYSEYPQYMNDLVTSTGHVYSLGCISVPGDPTDGYRFYINYDNLEKMGYTDVPATLDDFVQMLRDVKAYGEANGLDLVPYGGNYANYNSCSFLLNALGYNRTMDYSGSSTRETDIFLRNGEVVMPAFDKDVFTTYLETMNTMYKEGLMESEYYTMDADTCKAHLAEGKYETFSSVPGLYTSVEYGSEWYAAMPLTSEFNDKAFWFNYTGHTIGEFVISAETQYPELCVAFADYFYGENRNIAFWGPNVNQTELLTDGFDGWYYNYENGGRNWKAYEENTDKYETMNVYRFGSVCLWANSFGLGWDPDFLCDENGNSTATAWTADGDTLWEIAKVRKTYDNFNKQFQSAQVLGYGPYMTDEYTPTIFYFDEETNDRVLELKTLIDGYAQAEIAKFVVGARDLSEVDQFYAELENLGAAEYVQYFADYYAMTK